MEIIIAVGLGAWFVLAGVVSCIAVFKDFANSDIEEKK